jgi:hypothetical protein
MDSKRLAIDDLHLQDGEADDTRAKDAPEPPATPVLPATAADGPSAAAPAPVATSAAPIRDEADDSDPFLDLAPPWSAEHAADDAEPFLDLAPWGAVRTFDTIATEIIAERVFADGGEAIVDDFDDGQPDEGDRYVAGLVLRATDSEVKFVETLNERRKGVGDGLVDDPAMVASLQRLARTAWIHTSRARAAAVGAEWDPVIGPLAARAVARAHRAARAIAGAAARAVTRVAIRARNARRAWIGGRGPLSPTCRPVSPSSRARAPHARRVRASAVASAGSGGDEPSPEPPGAQRGARLPAVRLVLAGSLRSAQFYSDASGCIDEAAQELTAAGHPVDVAVVGVRVVYCGEEQIKTAGRCGEALAQLVGDKLIANEPAQVGRGSAKPTFWALTATDFTRLPRPNGGAQ